jgi:phenylpropionate dioxygenase-like ring-hydroxylating dioxygenase large terminal subunit
MDREAQDWSAHWALAGRCGMGLERVDVTTYTSAQVFEAEREKIFRKTWIPVAREAEIAEPGAFIRREIFPLETGALITRDKDGRLHAFHNTCLHRGSTLVAECGGKANSFVCPYHAWTYGLDGKLRGMPGREHFPHVDLSTARLKPIHLDVWNGFVFLNFDTAPAKPLADTMGELGRMFGDVPFGDYPHVMELTWDINANWKALMEASNEAYHVSVLHRRTLSDQMTSAENPINNLYDPFFSPPHATAMTQANPAWKPDQAVMQFVYATEAFRAQPGGVHEDAAAPSGPMSFLAHPAVNRAGLPSMAAQLVLLFPFTCLQMLANRYIWFQYWPVSVDRTRFVMRLYSAQPPGSWREAFAEAHMAAYTRDIATEDAEMTATQHRGFRSGGVSEVVFGENECLLRFFHQMVGLHLEGGDPGRR